MLNQVQLDGLIEVSVVVPIVVAIVVVVVLFPAFSSLSFVFFYGVHVLCYGYQSSFVVLVVVIMLLSGFFQ